MRAALTAVRRQHPERVVLAVPVAPPEVLAGLAALVDEQICPVQPARMEAVGAWYEDFSQTSDEEVLSLPGRHGMTKRISWRRRAGSSDLQVQRASRTLPARPRVAAGVASGVLGPLRRLRAASRVGGDLALQPHRRPRPRALRAVRRAGAGASTPTWPICPPRSGTWSTAAGAGRHRPGEPQRRPRRSGPATARLGHRRRRPGRCGRATGPRPALAGPEADVWTALNGAFAEVPWRVTVSPGVAVAAPLVVVHWLEGEGVAVFPRLEVEVAEGASLAGGRGGGVARVPACSPCRWHSCGWGRGPGSSSATCNFWAPGRGSSATR